MFKWIRGLFAPQRRETIPTPEGAESPQNEPQQEDDSVEHVRAKLEDNIQKLDAAFHAPVNDDYVKRRFLIDGIDACLIYVEGMILKDSTNQFIISPCMDAGFSKIPAGARINYLSDCVISQADVRYVKSIKDICTSLLGGKAALFLDGEISALEIDVRGYEKRAVGEPSNEGATQGANEGFIESIRTNITLVRRIVQSADLVTEMGRAGVEIPTDYAILYHNNLADPGIIALVKQRIGGIKAGAVPSIGHMMQLIEDKPNSLLPQMVMTERPDRAASFIMEGQVVILMNNSPYALAMPITFFHLMNAPDDAFSRWQYGTFSRIIRYIGLFLSVYLPSLYVAVVVFHQELLPMELLTAISESHSMVPFPMLIESLLMMLALELTTEAGIRLPGGMGVTLSIVGALILGQAAVAAKIVSPMLIIIVAVSGLGGFCVPNYSMSIGMRIIRYIMLMGGGVFGFVGITMLTFLFFIRLCAIESFGMPIMAPFAPAVGSNPDRFIRFPIWMQSLRTRLMRNKGQGDSGE